jgi:DNA-binding beta-propeller fold protein YncE
MSELSVRRVIPHLGLAAVMATAACGGGEEVSDPCTYESGTACTWAGVKGSRGFNDDGKHRVESWFTFVSDLEFGPDGLAYVLDYNNHRVRRLEADDTFTTVMGTDYEGDGDRVDAERLPEGNPKGALGTEVALNHPTDVKFLPNGDMVLAAWHNNKLRVMDMDTGVVTVLSGNGYGFAGDESPAWTALFNQPKAVEVGDDGTIYTIDQRNERIRMIEPDGDRMIRTIGGNGQVGYTGDGGPALEAAFHWDNAPTPAPSGSLLLRGSVLYIADTLNHCIRTLDLETGVVESIAGTGEPGYSGDGGDAIEAKFNQPVDLEWGPDGHLYVADRFNNVIRAIDLDSNVIETVAGNGEQCARPTNCYEQEENVAPLDLQLSEPHGLAFDPAGDLYIADAA